MAEAVALEEQHGSVASTFPFFKYMNIMAHHGKTIQEKYLIETLTLSFIADAYLMDLNVN